jgi:hypothetical protein
MSYCDAAEKIIREEAKPLKYSEIASKAISKGCLHSESETPNISMYVSLRTEIRRREQRNEPQRFMFLGNGLFTLVELVTGVLGRKTKSALEQVRESRAKRMTASCVYAS